MAAYGRLDVYWPDGPIENYALDKPIIAIGRSSGNDIVLDTNAVSRYHVSISLEGDKILLRDLEAVNGTYVDGVRMEANATRQLKGGEEIQIGDVRLIFQPLENRISDSAAPCRGSRRRRHTHGKRSRTLYGSGGRTGSNRDAGRAQSNRHRRAKSERSGDPLPDLGRWPAEGMDTPGSFRNGTFARCS